MYILRLYPQPLFFRQRVAVVHVATTARPSAEHPLLLLFICEPFNLGFISDDPRGQLVLLHEARLTLWVPGVLPTTIHVHTLTDEKIHQVTADGDKLDSSWNQGVNNSPLSF